MAFETLDLGRIIATAEGIKGMRREAETDKLREMYLNTQIQGLQQQQKIQGVEQQANVDARTARQRYLEADAIMNSSDPVRAAREFAPELVQQIEAKSGPGSFDQLGPDAIKQLAGMAREKAASIAGIALRGTPEQQFAATQAANAAETAFGRQKELSGIQHENELAQIAATGAEARKTAEIGAPGRAMKGAQALRKEFEGLQTVQNYRAVQPIIESAKKAPDNGYGDMDLIYAVGKILDPGSVVREGELALTIAAGSPLQRMLGTTRFSIEKGGRLTPKARKQIIGMLQGRVGALQDAYSRERQRFSQYATEGGFEPSQVVGADSAPSPANVIDFSQLPP